MKQPSQLDQILSIRKLRAQSRRRNVLKIEARVRAAQAEVGTAQSELTHLVDREHTLHREGLKQLVGATVTGMEALLRFNAEKSAAKQQVAQARTELQDKQLQVNRIETEKEAAQNELQRAEKRLIGIEEIILEDAWKEK